MKQAGVTPTPDPCRDGCVLASFRSETIFVNGECSYWMELWGQVGRSYKSGDDKPTEYYIDYQSLPTLFQIYGIDSVEDRQFVLRMMSRIFEMYGSSAPLSVEQIFGWADIPDS